MKTLLRLFTILILAACALTSVAQAHVLPGDAHGFNSGAMHPFHGLDHMLAMIAVGLWAAQLGGRARWAVPTCFVGVMALGAAAAMAGWHVRFVEQGIVLSVMALTARLPMAASLAVVGFFALFHGHSHGTEMPVNAVGFAYGAGFVLATALLHACGIGLAYAVRAVRLPVIRWAGAAIGIVGVVLALG
jgi:urease accessory protein